MTILLDAIQFCHDAGLATRIRWDATREVVLPEWRRGACVAPEDSPAAYAISEIKGHTITIKARFRRMVPDLNTVEIHAIDSKFQNRELQSTLPLSSPLGEVVSRYVTFGPDGLSELEVFELAGTKIEELGVGVWETSWQWQYRHADGKWVDFDRTEHRVFGLLEKPKAPWAVQIPPPIGLSLPRVDALEFACRWAQGSRTRTEVAARVTRGIYRLGPDLLRYDRPNGGNASYLGQLTRVLERVRGGEGNGVYVNCQDCAFIVTTLSNLLGCALWSTAVFDGDSIQSRPIAINPIILIGETNWGFPFPELGEVFDFHEVAFDGEATANDRVFDACLMVDGDEDPTKVSPHRIPLVPAGLPFSQAKGLAYRERFAAPAGRGCLPDEYGGMRWATEPAIVHLVKSRSLRNRQSALLAKWRGTRSLGADILFFPFEMTGDEVAGWRAIRAERAIEGGGVLHLHFLMAPEHGGADSRIRVETWQLPSRVQAHEYLARLFDHLEGGQPPRLEPPPVGDVAFASNRYSSAFCRGNLVVRLLNAGINLISVEDAARTLDHWLTHRPEVPPDSGPAELAAPTVQSASSFSTGFKYFADFGELSIKDGNPILQGATVGCRVVRVALNPTSGHVAEMVELSVEQGH